jgi:hypothetical protein
VDRHCACLIATGNLQKFSKKRDSPDPLFLVKKENFSDTIVKGKPVLLKNYFAPLPASYSTRTGAIVFVPIDRRTRMASLRQ